MELIYVIILVIKNASKCRVLGNVIGIPVFSDAAHCIGKYNEKV